MVERPAPGGASSASLLGAAALSAFVLAVSCGRSKQHHVPPQGDLPSDGGDTATATGGRGGSSTDPDAGTTGGRAGSVSSGGSSGSGTGGMPGEAGVGNEPECGIAPTGLVRLSFPQAKASLAALLGAPAAEEITLDLDIATNETADLPALRREGQAYDDANFTTLDDIAQATGAYVRANAAAVTGCAAPLTNECARAFLVDFAERAFRKTAEGAELELVLGVYDGGQADLGASVEEALEAGVYAAIESPRFAYRFELGALDAPSGTVPLEPHEVANALSFFLTLGPPDAELLAAADAGALVSAADLEAQVARLLAGDAARARLAAAVGTHFGLQELPNAIFDSMKFPAWTPTLPGAMVGETRRFLSATLWSEPLSSLVTSRSTFVNEELAALYGISFPPPDGALDGAGFARVDLPEERAGLLTQGSFIVQGSLPAAGHSVVRRGFRVMQRLLCQPGPPTEGELDPDAQQQIVDAMMALQGLSQREQARYRLDTPFCAECHAQVDPYGVALEAFDAVGTYRQTDEQGGPVDSSAVLPDAAGGIAVASARELAAALAGEDRLARCLGATFLADALSDRWSVQDPPQSCEVQAIVDELRAGADQSFGGLVRAIALSPAFRERAKP